MIVSLEAKGANAYNRYAGWQILYHKRWVLEECQIYGFWENCKF